MRPIGMLVAALIALALPGCANMPPPLPERDVPFARPPELTERQAARVGRNVTVRIRNLACGGGVEVGTGFLLDDHTLVTNRHVVEGSSSLELETWNGRRLDAAVFSVGTSADLAIVRIDQGVGEAVEMAPEDPEPGTEVQAVGYALAGPQAVTQGEVVDYVVDDRLGNGGSIMRVDISVHPGNSGGPLIDGSGHVVGVVYAIETATGHGLVVPVSTLRDALVSEDALNPGGTC